jgi:hypothetical protein
VIKGSKGPNGFTPWFLGNIPSKIGSSLLIDTMPFVLRERDKWQKG